MEEVRFGDNYRDLCVESGVNAGFQFEFFCERCGDSWRTQFVPYRSGQASGWLGKVGSMVGGILGGAGEALEGLAESGWGKARDAAFRSALEQAKIHFHRCARCFQYVCDRCWNREKGLCFNCAPDARVEVEAARAEGEVYAAGEKAAQEGIRRGKKMEVREERQLVCPQCGTETKGAAFCPECGTRLAVKARCPRCSAEIPSGVKFCPQCGQKVGG
jgi:hypothetical protein